MGLLAAGSSSLSYQDQTEEEESLCCLKAPQCSLVDMHTWMNAHTQTHMRTHVNMAYIKHMQDEPHTHIQTVASCTCASTNAIEMLMPEDKRDGKSREMGNLPDLSTLHNSYTKEEVQCKAQRPPSVFHLKLAVVFKCRHSIRQCWLHNKVNIQWTQWQKKKKGYRKTARFW